MRARFENDLSVIGCLTIFPFPKVPSAKRSAVAARGLSLEVVYANSNRAGVQGLALGRHSNLGDSQVRIGAKWRWWEPIRTRGEQLDFAPYGASSESSLRPRLARKKPSRLIDSPSPLAGEVWTS
jgi:hypothetical protein